jgi:adenylyl-sulfate kinase
MTREDSKQAPNQFARRHEAGFAVLLTGFSGSGKTSIAQELGLRLQAIGFSVSLLDGEQMRSEVLRDLGFSRRDREANLRCAAMVAAEVVKHGGIAICSFIAPHDCGRREIRKRVQQHGTFFLVHVATPLAECERRDPKGLYEKARVGSLPTFTGISDVYEPPADFDFAVDTTGLTVSESTNRVALGLALGGLRAGVWIALGSKTEPTHPLSVGEMGIPNSVLGYPRQLHTILQAMAGRRTTLRSVAHKVGLERHTVEKIVRSVTGNNFRELQKTMLGERARVMLQHGHPIKEIAFELGFGSPQSFHRFIRASYGKTPSSLRGYN